MPVTFSIVGRFYVGGSFSSGVLGASVRIRASVIGSVNPIQSVLSR